MTRTLQVDTNIVPAPSTVLPAPAGVRMTREGLLALERNGEAWRFMPLAMQALAQCPDDVELRLTLIVALARLGLNALALEHFESLPKHEQTAGDLPQLGSVLADAAGAEVISPRKALRRAEQNARALSDREVDLSDALARFRERVNDVERFAASDGNVVRRRRNQPGFAAFERFSDEMRAVRTVELPHLDSQGKPKPVAEVRPYVVVGADPPFLLQRVWRESPVASDGYQPWIACYAADADALIEGLALADIQPIIRDPRVYFFVGEGAGDELARYLDARDGTTLQCVLLELPTSVRALNRQSPDRIIESALDRQSKQGLALRKRVDAIYEGRDRDWWAKRYAAALSCDAPAPNVDASPLRVLIPTCRYSTYVQHCASDLAQALQSVGCDARILIEPDNVSRLTQLAYLREYVDFEPDLIVLINYTREQFKEATPANVPFVCWIQDRMPHLFDERTGAAQGEFDFVIGHTYGELFKQFNWPRERAWRFPVAVSERKFHDGPVDDALRERFACDVAYMTHQSESPAAMHQRMAATTDGPFRRMLDAMFHELQAALEREPLAPVQSVVHQLVADLGAQLDPQRRFDYTALRNTYAFPLAERMFRWQTTHWLGELAEERGWKLHLYGKGWERQPLFARFAAGQVDHEREARAAYRCAGAHIHASGDTSAHQRVFECYLSGGLPLRRLAAADLETIECELARRRLARLVEQGVESDEIDPWSIETSTPIWRRICDIRRETGAPCMLSRMRAINRAFYTQRMGASTDDARAMAEVEAEVQRRARLWFARLPAAPIETLLEASLPRPWATSFWSKETLADRLERVLRDRELRCELTNQGRELTIARFTLERFAEAIISSVHASLDDSRHTTQALSAIS